MDAHEHLRGGNIADALVRLQEQVRAEPSKGEHRVFLFQLLAVLGQWDRALTQLNVLADLDASALAMVQVYREALRCEVFRQEVFAGRRSPLLFGDPEQWIALLIEALRLTAQGQHGQSQELRAAAFEAAPASSGTIDSQAFEWIADADTRLGPILEAIVNGRYYWVPFQYIREVRVEEPADLRDLVWMPVHFAWANGGETVGLIPTRYPGSEADDDDQIRLGRKTVWVEPGAATYLGLGQRMFATDAGEYPLMDVRQILLDTPHAEFAKGDTGAGAPDG